MISSQGSLLGPPPPSVKGPRQQASDNGVVSTDIESVELKSEVELAESLIALSLFARQGLEIVCLSLQGP